MANGGKETELLDKTLWPKSLKKGELQLWAVINDLFFFKTQLQKRGLPFQ